MSEHPIEGLMITAMNSISDMIDVNTIIGDPIETSNNTVIIPISKVCFGFAAGGSDFKGETLDDYKKKEREEAIQYRLPFGGGSGAGVNINPIAFLVVQPNGVKLLPVNHTSSVDKLLDYMPDLIEKAQQLFNENMENKKEENSKVTYSFKDIDTKMNKKEPIEPKKKRRRKIEENEYEYDEDIVNSEVEYDDFDD